jgi:hypothetical protein
MEFVTQDKLRQILRERWLKKGSQAALAREIGVKPQNLSVMLQGASINGRVLTWLGYEAVNDLYRPLSRKPKRKAG